MTGHDDVDGLPGPAAVIHRAVRAWSEDRRADAVALLEGSDAVDGDGDGYPELVAALRRYLRDQEGVAGSRVYDARPDAFAAYIRGGGNVELYDALVTRLATIYLTHRPQRLLDIGPGDGRALLAAWQPELGAVDLVEPARTLLAAAAAALDEVGADHDDHTVDVETFLAGGVDTHWPMAQATFSLQSLAPAARREVLRRLAERCDRLVIAEFDVPTREDPFAPAWFLRCVTRVEHGLREYGDDRDLVAQGFLVPMVLGFFDTAAASSHEQPIAAWGDDLRDAGFAVVEPPTLLWDYWWAPAYLLHAAPGSG